MVVLLHREAAYEECSPRAGAGDLSLRVSQLSRANSDQLLRTARFKCLGQSSRSTWNGHL